MLLIDVSGSNDFGSINISKRDLTAELAAVLAFSAIQNNDKVGVIFFSDQIEKFIPPKKFLYLTVAKLEVFIKKECLFTPKRHSFYPKRTHFFTPYIKVFTP